MKSILSILALVMMITTFSLVQTRASGSEIVSNGGGGGDWHNSATWLNGIIPTSADSVVIQPSDSVFILANASCAGLLVQQNAKLSLSAKLSATNVSLNGKIVVYGDTLSASGSVVVGANGIYQHARDGGRLPIATWSTGSTLLLTGIVTGSPSNGNQNFHHVVWNCPTQTSNLNLGWNGNTISGNVTIVATGTGRWQLCAPPANTSASVTIIGDVIQSGGNFSTNGTGNGGTTITINHYGNINVTGGNFSVSRGTQGGTGTATWNFNGSTFSVANATMQNSNTAGAKFVMAGPGAQTLSFTNVTLASGSAAPLAIANGSATTLLLSGVVYQTNGFPIVVQSGGTLKMGETVFGGNGAFTLEPGATIESGHANGLDSNLATTGTKTLSTSAHYVFNGSAAQSTGALLPSVVGSLTINNAAGVSLSSSTSVSGTLAFSSGKLLLGANDITIGSSGTITGASASNFIVTNGTGMLKRSGVGASDVLFPLGPSAISYNPVTINNAGIADDFSVRVQTAFDNPPNLPNSVVNRQWTINEATPGGSNATIRLQWSAADQASGFNPAAAVYIGRYSGTQWVDVPAAVAGSDPYTATASGFTSFSAFGVGNVGALPVQLISFTATRLTPVSVRLDWVTVSEINNYGFEVQRSAERSGGFVSISNLIPGQGTSNRRHEYSFVDQNAYGERWYYRLKQIDLDGTFRFTEPIEVVGLTHVAEGSPTAFTLLQNYPNPFNPSTQIRFSVDRMGRAQLDLFNLLGQKVATLFDGIAEPGRWYVLDVNVQHLPSGIYPYSLRSGGKSDVKKMIVVK